MNPFLNSLPLVLFLGLLPGNAQTIIARSAQPRSQSQPASLPATQQLPEDMRKLYDYDAKQPLDIQTTKLYERDGHTVFDITYTSPRGGRVPAYLIVPSGKGPFAGVVFGHWGNGNRTEFLPEAELYAQIGVISILPAYPWTRPAPWHKGLNPPAKPDEDILTQAQTVVDLRRAFDLLLARPDIDPKRLAYVGHSYGAQWGAILMAVDRRMKASVLVGGVPSMASIVLESDNPEMIGVQTGPARQAVEKYVTAMAVEDAIRYIPFHVPIPVLFQFAQFEQYARESAARKYYDAAPEPKQQKWYNTGHDLNDPEVLLDRAAWLQKEIGIGAIVPVLQKEMKAAN